MKTCLIDIATTARPESAILRLMPEFKAPSNYKDADKIAAHVANQKVEWLDKAAFSALTGRVLEVGTRIDGQSAILDTEDEVELLKALWQCVARSMHGGAIVVGFDLVRQKLPFAARRSWSLGVPVPDSLFPLSDEFFIDLLEQWRCGDKHEFISLADLGKFLGITPMVHVNKAAAFASSRAGAVASLTNDLLLTEQIMQRMVPGAGDAAKTSPPAETAQSATSGEVPTVASGAENLSLATDDY